MNFNILFIILVIILVLYFYFNQMQYIIGDLICERNDVSCSAWTNKDILSKCDAFCVSKLGDSFSHTQKYKINYGSIDCKCQKAVVNQISNIPTPGINVVSIVPPEDFPSKAGQVPSSKIEKLTNTGKYSNAETYDFTSSLVKSKQKIISNPDYDNQKNDQYKRYKSLIFGR